MTGGGQFYALTKEVLQTYKNMYSKWPFNHSIVMCLRSLEIFIRKDFFGNLTRFYLRMGKRKNLVFLQVLILECVHGTL